MNWTSRTPIENVKCIVETNSGCVFPAHFINGSWWNTEKGFPVEGVKRWIVYPEGEEPNDYIAPSVLLKYVMQAYRESQAKLKSLRDLNQQLCKQFGVISKQFESAKTENGKLKQEAMLMRKQNRKARTFFKNIGALLAKSEILGVEVEGEELSETPQ